MEVSAPAPNALLPGDPRLVDHIVCELKSQGIFDRFRKECIADVDTKPAYQNLRQRVEGSVNGFLKNQVWRPDMNKNQLRETLRKNIHESGYFETGVERIVDQVVNPKINAVFLPQVEEVVYRFLGLQKPSRNGPSMIDTSVDLLPTDLDPVSPDSEVLDRTTKIDETDKPDDSKNEDDESPPFEPLNDADVFSHHDESTNDSHLSGMSGLTSHGSRGSGAASPIKGRFALNVTENMATMSIKTNDSELKSIVATTTDLYISDSNDKSESGSRVEPKSDDGHRDKNRSDSERYRDRHDRRSDGRDRKGDKERDRSKDEGRSQRRDSSRDGSRGGKDDKNRVRSSGSGSKHGSGSKDRSGSKSDRRDKERSRSSKSESKRSDGSKRAEEKRSDSSKRSDGSKRSTDDKKGSDSKSHGSESKSSKERKVPSGSSRDRERERKDTKSKSKRDDHYGSKSDKTRSDRRSTDRDSNDGSGKTGATGDGKERDSNAKPSKSSDSSCFGGSGGDSGGQSDKVEHDMEQMFEALGSEIKMKKPKFASNVFEARKLMKVRKRMEKMEKRRRLALADERVDSPDGGDLRTERTLEARVVVSPRSPRSPKDEVEEVKIDLDVSDKPISVISKASWDEIEARINMNIDYNSYVDENTESNSSNRSDEKDKANTVRDEQMVKTPEKKSSDDEDCLYFSAEVDPLTERFFKRIDDLKKATSNIENMLDSKRNRERVDSIEETGETSDLQSRLKRRHEDGVDSDNNNKRMHVLEDVSNVELEEDDFSGFNNSNTEEAAATCPRTTEPRRTSESPTNESVDIRRALRKANEERDEIVQQLIQPSRSGKGKDHQRYSSDDLYKPRPMFPGTRRTRGVVNNADKGSEETITKRR